MKSRNRIIAAAGLFLSTLLIGTKANAQFGPSPPWFIGGGSYGGGTVAGNFMFGAAQVIRAEGDYNNLTTQGMINFETARSQYIDNAAKWSQFYSRMREANEAYRRQKYEQNRPSAEVLAKVAAWDLPRTLNSDELDPVTGVIHWPEAVVTDQFAALRQELERLVELATWTTRTPQMTSQIREEVNQMRELLRSNMESLTPADYVDARKFLDSLEFAMTGRRHSPPPPPSPGPTRG